MTKKHPKIFFGILSFVITAMILTLIPTKNASSLSGSQFQAGRIIDNSVFFNTSTMSPQQIQEFLNAKVPECDTNGIKPVYGTTRAEYSASQGHPAPFICLKNYSQWVPTVTNGGSDLCKNSITGATKTAAQIIYDAAQACGINPQVLIVLLQKEQSLITDDWPWDTQYRSATGYGCPDTAPCDAEYYGFFNQVYQAAKAFRRYEANPNSYNYKANRNNNIYYHPSLGACGSSNVYIENQATANLYIYTPYQPNTAALNNLYGTGDGCSAYGNRNFWRMFNDWFGTTQGANYSWSLVSQSVFTDATKTTGASTTNMPPESRVYASIVIRNTGNQTWSNTGSNPVRFGTMRPYERSSPYCDPSWPSCSRPATMSESSVAPGATATFNFWLKAPGSGGQTSEYFGPVVEGVTWMQDIGLFYSMSSQAVTYSWQWASQYAYTDETKVTHKSLDGILPGDRVYVGFTAKNTGNMTWQNTGTNPIRVGTLGPQERTSLFSDEDWIGTSRTAVMKESSVAPSATGTFEFWITIPNNPGVHNERFGLVAEGRTWFNDTGLSYGIGVARKVYSWQWASQYAYTDETKVTHKSLDGILPGDRVYVGFTAKNTGNMTWQNTGTNPIRVGTLGPIERTSLFAPGSNWLGASRPAKLVESSIAPGATGTFEFWMTVPNNPGVHNERFGLVAEGITWFNDTGLSYGFRVQ